MPRTLYSTQHNFWLTDKNGQWFVPLFEPCTWTDRNTSENNKLIVAHCKAIISENEWKDNKTMKKTSKRTLLDGSLTRHKTLWTEDEKLENVIEIKLKNDSVVINDGIHCFKLIIY